MNDQEKRARILAATRTLLAEKGYHGTTMAAVARAADVAAGTIYLYFKDKSDLMHQHHVEVMQQVATHAFAGEDQEPTLEARFKRIWRQMFAFMVANPDLLTGWNHYIHSPECDTEAIRLAWREIATPLLSIFEQGVEQGILKPLPHDLLSALSIDTAMTLAEKQVLGWVDVLDEATKALVADVSWRSICA
nr:TetR family transcriptional regulator [bacterium]